MTRMFRYRSPKVVCKYCPLHWFQYKCLVHHPGEEVTDPPPNKSPTPEDASAQSAASNASQQEEDSSQFASYQEESESKQEESEVNEVVQVAEESKEQCKDEESCGSESVAVDETSVQSSLGFDSNSEHNSMLNEREEEKQELVVEQNSSSASKVIFLNLSGSFSGGGISNLRCVPYKFIFKPLFNIF